MTIALHRQAHLAARWSRPLAVGLTGGILLLLALEAAYAYTRSGYAGVVGNDLHIYTDATARLFGGGSWFLDRQLGGAYPLVNGDVLYPPVAAFAFAPWLVLPLWLYLGIPAVGLAWLIGSWRPAAWTWPLIALCLLYPGTLLKWNAGNPSIYVALLTGLGLRFGCPSALILLKPSMFPLALIGVRDRRWWIVVAILALGSLPFLAATLEWPQVALNANGAGLLYSVADLPMALIPVIGWLGRRSPRPEGRGLVPSVASVARAR